MQKCFAKRGVNRDMYLSVVLLWGVMLVSFWKLIFFVVPCVSGFIELYYLFLFPDFKGVNDLC
jgi:hypothetical protein